LRFAQWKRSNLLDSPRSEGVGDSNSEDETRRSKGIARRRRRQGTLEAAAAAAGNSSSRSSSSPEMSGWDGESMSVWDNVENSDDEHLKQAEIWSGSWTTTRSRAQILAKEYEEDTKFRCPGCSYTTDDEWDLYQHITNLNKMTGRDKREAKSKKARQRSWNTICLPPSETKMIQWKNEWARREAQEAREDRGAKATSTTSGGGKKKGKCPNCVYAVTWHATHCCTTCMKDPHAGNHGPKCDQDFRWSMGPGTGPHPPSHLPHGGTRRDLRDSREPNRGDSRERRPGGTTRGGGRTRDHRGLPSMGVLPPGSRNRSPAAGSGEPGTSWRDDSRERGEQGRRRRSRSPVRRPWAGGRVVRGPPQRGGGF
jgi:hypothetical protein